MRLGVKPIVFLGRLLLFFFLTYALWRPVAPAYTYVLATLTGGFLHLTEVVGDGQVITDMRVRETAEGRPAVFFQHRKVPAVQSGIPAEWVQANLVLLIPLMLATPARSYRQRLGRLGLALGLAVVLQVLDIAVTVKHLYADEVPGYSSSRMRWLYGFADTFAQSMDTQLFPFAIWAGVHFNQLLGRSDRGGSRPAGVPAAGQQGSRQGRRAERRIAKP
jgi:hypothetical protein